MMQLCEEEALDAQPLISFQDQPELSFEEPLLTIVSPRRKTVVMAPDNVFGIDVSTLTIDRFIEEEGISDVIEELQDQLAALGNDALFKSTLCPVPPEEPVQQNILDVGIDDDSVRRIKMRLQAQIELAVRAREFFGSKMSEFLSWQRWQRISRHQGLEAMFFQRIDVLTGEPRNVETNPVQHQSTELNEDPDSLASKLSFTRRRCRIPQRKTRQHCLPNRSLDSAKRNAQTKRPGCAPDHSLFSS